MAVIILTTGVPGCGKTYVRASRFLVDDFLVNTDGVHYSNFPLNPDVIAPVVVAKRKRFSFFGRRSRPCTESDVMDRIRVIPDEILQLWKREISGPWDYFSGVDLKYAHIAIDEIHNFISASKSPDYLAKWDEFLGEVRHRGCTFEGLTQDIDQVDKILTGRAAVRLELIPAEDLRDPFFKVKMGDWYELKAGISGHYHKTVFEFEKRKQGRQWKTNNCRRFLITPDYFPFYRSFEASLTEKEKGQGGGDRSVKHEYELRSFPSLLFWFFCRNWFSFAWRILLAFFVIWLCFFGGLNYFISGWLASANRLSRSRSAVAVPSPASPRVSSSSVSSSVPRDAKDLEFQQLVQAKTVDPYKPAMFFDGFCWLRNGLKISVGFQFKGGFYDGKKVSEISSSDRFYKLDDGSIVSMY